MDMMAGMGDMEGGPVVIGTRGVLMNMTLFPMVLLLPCTPLKSNMMSTMWTLFLPPTFTMLMKLLPTMPQLCTILLLTMLLHLPLLSFTMAMPCTLLKSSMMSTLLTFSLPLMCMALIMLRQQLSRIMLRSITMPLHTALQCTLVMP